MWRSLMMAAMGLMVGCGSAKVTAEAVVGTDAARGLVITRDGASSAIVAVKPGLADAAWERRAALDLVRFIQEMSGAKLELADSDAAVATALGQKERPVLVVGSLALEQESSLNEALAQVAKKNPTLRADAIALRQKGNRVYVAGNHDEAHYYAASYLLRLWGCRWYMPTEFGQCIPEQPTLTVEKLDYAYGSPFEVRGFWIAWNGEQGGAPEFRRRNFMNDVQVSGGHVLGKYTKSVIPEGKTQMNIPIAEDATADAIANHPDVDRMFSEGKSFSLGMEDGIYESDSELDAKLRANLYDKYFLTATLTDNFMVLYNKVCQRLLAKHPESKSRIGFLAYSNITIPPQRKLTAAKPLVASLAPIDIDPNHSMDDPRSPPKQEYREMMYRWAQVMEGRVFIYDYDQGMLVWRDIPNPVVQWIAQDIQHYRKAGILGLSTESRNAIATVFVNLHVRGQLMWDPDANVEELLADFYRRFYGPMAEPMADYWNAIHRAWRDTLVTEHEYLAIPAIYTPVLVEELRKHLAAAEAVMEQASHTAAASRRDWPMLQQRLKFTRLSLNLIDQYTAMARAVATDCDYAAAVAHGEKAIATRYELGNMNTTFTTRVIPTMPVPENDRSPAWLLGEVAQYRQLAAATDGTTGRLIAKLPLDWALRRDPNDTGVVSGFAYHPLDLTYWNEHGKQLTPEQRKDYPTTEWEMVRTDLYAQAQGILHPDWQSFTGYLWYRAEIPLTKAQLTGKVHVMFPGLFNEAWLYVNGHLVAHRPFPKMWWLSDYRFEWDVDLTGHLQPGQNTLTLRLHNPHHFGGLFRRPFLYEPKNRSNSEG